jgi:hypothetical protein
MKYTRAKQAELTEIVRQYSRALINYYSIPPFAYPTTTTSMEGHVEFGRTTKKDVKKKRKKKKRKNIWGGERLRALLRQGKTYDDQELAKLAKQAKLAIQQASQLAGEPVIYCCGFLRIESRINYECTCSTSRRHKTINSLISD